MNSYANYRENDLFRSGHSRFLNACVGRNGGPYDLYAYSLGYFDAARTLVQAVDHKPTRIDLAVYPITYNYRHAIELALKYMISRIPQLRDEQEEYKTTHDLAILWKQLRPYISRDENFHDDGVISFMDKIMADIAEFDPNAEVFRFPTDTKGGFYLQDSAFINIQVLAEAMEEVREIFETWFFAIGGLQYYKVEEDAANYLRQEL